MTTPNQTSPYSLFISDLHLCETRPEITQIFLSFLQNVAINAESLYILGDFFEYWAGDDDVFSELNHKVANELRKISLKTKIFLMHGNRDFLIGDKFVELSGAALINDPTLITLYGHKVLLSHGDMFCTDDIEYQNFRAQVRNPVWQNEFLSHPLVIRKNHIENLRKKSELAKSKKSDAIMDVNQYSLIEILIEYGVPNHIIHGHTHRPSSHKHVIGKNTCTRWVLGDWYHNGSYLKFDKEGCSSFNCG